ncbi:MAG: hypothetical protein LAT65_13085 [Saccharospirillum sp.]|nr:hypothetical protein [Saccharospirillum sp.]
MTSKRSSLPLYILLCSALTLAGCNSSSGGENNSGTGTGDGSQDNGHTDTDNGQTDNDTGNQDNEDGSTILAATWIHPLPQGYSLNAVIEHNHKLVAVGARGTVLISSDGSNWTTAETASTTLRDIVSNGPTLVAVGGGNNPNSGARAFFSEDDGNSWESATLPDDVGGLNAVTWTGNHFIALGAQSNAHISSTDGKVWTKVNAGPSRATSSVASNGARLVTGNGHEIHLSEDGGATWNREVSITSGVNSNVTDVHFNGSQFAVSGGYNQYGFRSSTIGKSWSDTGVDFNYAFALAGPAQGSAILNSLTFTDSSYWFADNKGSIHKRAGDEATWERVTTVNSDALNDITHTSKGFFAVGNNGAIVSSTNGTSWSTDSETTLTANGWQKMAKDDLGRMVAISENGRAVYSDNGTDWSEVTLTGSPYLTDIAWTGTRFVASGTNTVAHSLDGESWSVVDPRTGGLNVFFSHVAGRNDVWMAMVGNNLANDVLAICTPSGCTLDEAPDASRSLVATDNGYLVISFGGWARLSSDGDEWTTSQRAINTTNMGFVRLSSIGNKVVAAAPTTSHSRTAYSTDGGLTWSASEFPEEAVVTASNIFNDGERFYLKDDGRNTLWVSDNGESWQAYELSHPLRGLARKDDTLYLLGEGNHILKVQMQ